MVRIASPAAILRASKAVPGGAVATAPPQGVPGWSGSLSPLARELAAPDSYRNAYGPFLPRPPQDFTQGAFGPFSPILPVPVDAPEDNGRAAPRREQYQTGWNLPTGEPGSEGIGKLASFSTLRTLADLYSVARACIQLRKNEIRGIEWDIVPTKDAAKAMRGSPSQMRDFGERRGKALAFFRRPDPDYFSWASWVDDVLEQMFVFDSLSIYLAPKRGKGMRKGLLGSDLDCLQLIDGQTIRPLYDVHGASPRPPAPALQQYLFGVPRSDFTTMVSGRDIQDAGLSGAEARAFRGDQLLYLPYTRRRWSPYGMAAVERALVPIMSGLQKQGWQLDYFRQGTVPAVYVSPGDTAMTPNQIRELQDALNAIAGDPAWHHKIIVLPPGSKTMPQRDTQLADQFDEIVRVDTCMAFDVEPMELGIAPKVSTTMSPGANSQMAKMAQQKVDRKSTGPLLRFLASVCDHILRDLCRQDDMRFLFDGLEDEDDEATETGMVVQQVTSALRSIDEGREKLGLQPWGLKETQDPLLITPTGPVPLTAAVAQASAQAQTAQHLADNPPPRALPPAAAPRQGRPAPAAAGSDGDAGQSPGHEAAEAAQGEQQADAQRGGTTASKAVAAELDALARHLRKGRRITTWQARHLPAVALAVISEDLAKGLSPDQAVGVTRAMLLKAGPPQQPAGQPQDAQGWPGWQYDLALAGMYTAEVTAAFTAATTAASALLAAWWKGTLAVTRDALVSMIRSEVARKVGKVLSDLWREAWHLGTRSATAVATMSAPDWGGWQPGDVDAAALVSDSAGLRRLLAAHGVSVIQAVSDTGMDGLAQAIAQAVADGDSAGSLARRLPEILRVPQRAGMIARTEIARAVSAATRDTYRDMGVSRKEWLIAPEDACPVCKANARAGAVPLDATFPDGSPCPPAHPWCRCVLLPAEISGIDLTDPDAFEYKYQRVADLNGEVTWRDSRDDDEGGYAAGGGGMMPRPHAADGSQYRPGGVPGSSAGGEPPRWDGSGPEPRVMSAPDDEDDADYPPSRGIPSRPGEYWPAGYMDGYWPQGGHGTGQAGMSSPGGGERGRPPNGIGKVGPKGYVHGWIFVGIPGAGAEVHHPQFGKGKVTGHDAAHARVRFGDGTERAFAHQGKSPVEPEAAPGPAHFEHRPESDGGPAGVMTAAEARKWGNANWPGRAKLPPDQYRALLDYSRASAYQINRYLRTGKLPDRGKLRTPTPAEKRRLDAEIAVLDKATKGNPTPSQAMVVHRGTGLAEFGNVTPDKLVGKQVKEPAFLSTSVGKTVSSGFGTEEVHLQLSVPKGTPAFYLDKVSSFKGERELLLGSGLSYKITSARLVRGQWQVEAEVIPPRASKAASPGIAKGASDPSDPNPVDPEHVMSLMLANFPATALRWVNAASWIGPVEVPQDRIDTADEDSWAASGQPDAIKRFARAIRHGTGHTHPVILVQSPDNPKAVVIDGHHRTLAYRKLGRPVKAYVGQVEQVTPEMLETHSFQQHQGASTANKSAAGYDLNSRSGMISLDIPDGLIDPLPGGVTDFHVTIVYLGPAVDDDAFAQACEQARAAAAQAPGPLAAVLTGIGSFPPSASSDGKVPVFIPARIPGAEVLRSELEDLSASEHKDWKPHVTLAYLDEGDPLPAPREPVAVTFTHLSAHRGDDVERFPLGAASKVAAEGNAQTLRDYWSGHGHGGPTRHAFEKEIAWGTPGDFDRCVALVTEHGKMTPDQAKGFCNLRHHEALGYWPAQHAEMERGK